MKAPRFFLYSVAVVLFLTALAKFISSFGGARVLLEHDPLTNLQFLYLFRLVGSIETVVALACLFSKRIWIPTGLVAWLATGFLAYRIELWRSGWHKSCSCLGNFTDALHIKPETADTVMKIVLAYLLIGSYGTLFWLWRQRKKAAAQAGI
jgi:hypothetical protein